MKQILLRIILLASIASCTSVEQIGKVNMISNRNVNPKLSYIVLSTYAGGSKKELLRSRATSIENAVDKTVKKIPGGEFLMNAKIYLINARYFAVEGDVWGLTNNIEYRGFKVGDTVAWKKMGKYMTGTIQSLKDDKTCLIETENGSITEVKYDDISKVE